MSDDHESISSYGDHRGLYDGIRGGSNGVNDAGCSTAVGISRRLFVSRMGHGLYAAESQRGL